MIGSRFVHAFYIAQPRVDGAFHVRQTAGPIPRYLGCQMADVDGDKRDDLITSSGDIFLCRPDGSLSESAAMHLPVPASDSNIWTYVAAADFEHNGSIDIALLANSPAGATVWLYRNTRNSQSPFRKEPNAKFVVPDAEVNRDGPTVADFNSDGIPDLILTRRGNEGGAFILAGAAADGLSPRRITRIKLDYIPYYDVRFGVADFAGTGRPALAGFGLRVRRERWASISGCKRPTA